MKTFNNIRMGNATIVTMTWTNEIVSTKFKRQLLCNFNITADELNRRIVHDEWNDGVAMSSNELKMKVDNNSVETLKRIFWSN